jgi:hypothetical protein
VASPELPPQIKALFARNHILRIAFGSHANL